MSRLHGKGGSVIFTGGQTNVISWSGNQTLETADGAILGDNSRTADAGLMDNSGSYVQIADSTGGTPSVGDTGAATFSMGGARTYTGTILITGVAPSVDLGGNVLITVSWKGQGDMVIA